MHAYQKHDCFPVTKDDIEYLPTPFDSDLMNLPGVLFLPSDIRGIPVFQSFNE